MRVNAQRSEDMSHMLTQSSAPSAEGTFTPSRMMAALCTLQLVVWTAVPTLILRSLPTDTIESFLWGREGIVMSYKHPQLPAWTLEALNYLTGTYLLSGFLSSQLAIVTTFAVVFALGYDMMGPQAAIAGVLMLPITGFYSWGTTQFNHDVVQMPFWAIISWLLWRAQQRNHLHWWLILGAVSGLGLYGKFTTGLIIAFGAAWLFVEPQARRLMVTRGPWLAIATLFVVVTPMFVIMMRMDFIQITYAGVSSAWSNSNHGKLYYIGVQLALFAFLPLALWSSGMIGHGARRAPDAKGPLLKDARARRYLVWMGIGPPAILALASLFTGVDENWSKPMYNLVGLLVVAYLGRRLDARGMRRLTIWGLGMPVFAALLFVTIKPTQCYLGGRFSYACLPGDEIAARLQADFRVQTGAPLRIVAGEGLLMMATALYASDRPSMWTELNVAYSPWIDGARIRREGLLLVWEGGGPIRKDWAAWTSGREVGRESFVWAKGRPPIVLSYAVIPPGETDLPPLLDKLDRNTM